MDGFTPDSGWGPARPARAPDSVPIAPDAPAPARRAAPAPRFRAYAPAVANTGDWAGREAARTPVRFRERVVAAFRAPANLAYLAGLLAARVPAGALRDFALATLDDAAYSFSTAGEGRAYDVLMSDPVARRGALRPAVDLWGEVRRLNRVFFEERLAVLREHAALLEAGGDEARRRRGDPRAPAQQDDPLAADDEPYRVRMFVADSLRPPGLEHLNGAGPLYEVRENQSATWPVPPGSRGANSGRDAATSFGAASTDLGAYAYGADAYAYGADAYAYGAPTSAGAGDGYGGYGDTYGGCGDAYGGARRETFASTSNTSSTSNTNNTSNTGGPPCAANAVAGRPAARFSARGGGGLRGASPNTVPPCGNRAALDTADEAFLYGEHDAPWQRGNANRTPEQAMAEYWGDGCVASETAIGAPEQAGQAYGELYAWGVGWAANGGTRAQRYPEIQRWQILKREGVDTDIEETLGLAGREMDNHVRRWDMDRVREPRGQEYRRHGARSGHVM